MTKLSGKRAIITGSSDGIGKTIALRLANEGADVVVNYRSNFDSAQSIVTEIISLGCRSKAVMADVSDSSQVGELIKSAIDFMGGVDILVNNAGVTRDSLMLRMSEDDWDYVLDSNLKSAFICTKAVLPQMLRQKSGRIVNISSVVGIYGNPGQSNYTAAKAGLIGLTKTTAKEVGSRGITVNAVAPGFIKTKMVAGLSTEILSEVEKRVALGRLGNTEDVAGTVAFLVSPDASYITGQVISVDGGLVI